MLTVFHTADWHLGQSFCGFDRDFEHAAFLDWLLHELQSHQPDALLVAGDVFDSINPSALSQKRYFDFLASAHELLPALQIVITAGNHDAGARLARGLPGVPGDRGDARRADEVSAHVTSNTARANTSPSDAKNGSATDSYS